MYLSDRDLRWAIQTGELIVEPNPQDIDPSSIDLHLDNAAEARIWDIESYQEHEQSSGRARPELNVGRYHLGKFSRYLTAPPDYSEEAEQLVGKRGAEIILKPGGFLLWPTREVVGTPPENADFISFVHGKSTKARAGIVVHLTAPTIHVSWKGKITLEIANLGSFDIVLREGDVIAQLTVAKVTSPPARGAQAISRTYGQSGVHGGEG